ncbi:hypothetical protein DFJ73DRAFT_895663 [Zopfochytrium polystomum]|nr:hypothetical protein DFJ73DRAFT_895663 [Zopfochytrium polystomum]
MERNEYSDSDSDNDDDAAPPLFDPNLVSSWTIAYYSIYEQLPHTATLALPHFTELWLLHLEACFSSDFLHFLAADNVKADLIEDFTIRLTIGAAAWTVDVSDRSGDGLSGSRGGIANGRQRIPLECLTVRLASFTRENEGAADVVLLKALNAALWNADCSAWFWFERPWKRMTTATRCIFLTVGPAWFRCSPAGDLVARFPLWWQNDSWLPSLLASRPELNRLTISQRPICLWINEVDTFGDSAFRAPAEPAKRGNIAIRLSDCGWMRRERVQALDGLPNVEVVWSPED